MSDKDKKLVKQIVKLWHKTQVGPIKECDKSQKFFADLMWDMCDKLLDVDNGSKFGLKM